MKQKFLQNKKKIILAILLAASFMFPQVRQIIPAAEKLIPNDPQSVELAK